MAASLRPLVEELADRGLERRPDPEPHDAVPEAGGGEAVAHVDLPLGPRAEQHDPHERADRQEERAGREVGHLDPERDVRIAVEGAPEDGLDAARDDRSELAGCEAGRRDHVLDQPHPASHGDEQDDHDVDLGLVDYHVQELVVLARDERVDHERAEAHEGVVREQQRDDPDGELDEVALRALVVPLGLDDLDVDVLGSDGRGDREEDEDRRDDVQGREPPSAVVGLVERSRVDLAEPEHQAADDGVDRDHGEELRSLTGSGVLLPLDRRDRGQVLARLARLELLGLLEHDVGVEVGRVEPAPEALVEDRVLGDAEDRKRDGCHADQRAQVDDQDEDLQNVAHGLVLRTAKANEEDAEDQQQPVLQLRDGHSVFRDECQKLRHENPSLRDLM